MHPRVLIVDDDAEMREALESFLSAEGHECQLAADGAAALQVVDRVRLDAVICDVRMEGMDGLELLERVKRTHPGLPFVVMTAVAGVHTAVDAIKRGAFQYVQKPCDLAELRSIVASAIEERRRAEVDNTRSSWPPVADIGRFDLIGSSPPLRSLQACIEAVAASSAPVVITGETGSGKELVARAIHARSPRRDQPFVAVNTSAIPESLLEGEVFGHVRGAFTGAFQSRRGLLTQADGGTILLDEIGDMPISLQAKLLRVLQFGDVRPVGSERAHHVDVRILAATHRDLPALVREGRFREDLYFRLNVLPVVVPPLRDRRDDIPELAAHLLAAACLRAPRSPVRALDAEATRMLMEQPWPGNVRELATVIERVVVFGAQATVTLRDLTIALGAAASTLTLPWSFRAQPPWTLQQLTRAYTDWVLVETGGDKERAAAMLGIDLSTLYRWQRAQKH